MSHNSGVVETVVFKGGGGQLTPLKFEKGVRRVIK